MESTQTLLKKDFQAKVGAFLGYGRGAAFSETAWSTQQQNDITDCIESGYRRFIFPKLVGGAQYSWSFLRPQRSISFASGTQASVLPDDFGGLDEDRVTVTVDGSSTVYAALIPCNPELIRLAYAAQPSASGQPLRLAVQALEGVRNDGSNRKRLWVYPAADQDYTLTFAMYLRPGALSDDYPYAYGGPEHSETILQSCLAVAEERKDDMRGVHAQAFEEQLAASISADRRMQPQQFGRNTDRSDLYHRSRNRRDYEQVLQAAGIVDTTSLTGS